jgi:signal transduction histidine kinase
MQFIISLLGSKPYFNQPNGFLGWIGLILLLISSIWLCVLFRKILFQVNRKRIWLFFLFFLIQPLLSLFVGFNLSGTVINVGFPIMLLGAVPWMVAAGIIGPIPSSLLAIWSGIIGGLWGSHSLFGIICAAISSLIFSWAIRQNFNGNILRIIRHPAIAWLAVITANFPLHFLIGWFSINGHFSSGAAQAIAETPTAVLYFAIGSVIAAAISEVLFRTLKEGWYHPKSLATTKVGQSTIFKYLVIVGIICGLILVGILALTWNITSGKVLGSIKNQMQSSSEIISKSVPYLIQTGQSILEDNGRKDTINSSADSRRSALQQMLSSVPYFQQIYLLDSQSQVLDGYPSNSLNDLTTEDLARLHYVENGQGVQTYIISTSGNSNQSLLSFIVPIRGENNSLLGVVLGRTDLESNPFSQGILEELNTAGNYHGAAALVDEYNRIILSNGQSFSEDQFENVTTDGFQTNLESNSKQYVSSVQGGSWKVLMSVPNSEINLQVLKFIWPFIVAFVLIAALGYLGFYFYLSKILHGITEATKAVDRPISEELSSKQTGEAFSEIEKLRDVIRINKADVQNQLEEKEQLLRITNTVQAFGNYDDAIQPVLDLMTKKGADCVRVIIIKPELTLKQKSQSVIVKKGATADLFAYLDSQILDLLQKQNQLILPNAARSKQLNLMPGFLHPGAIIALNLIHDDQKLGILWAAFDQPRNFSKTDMQFYEQMTAEIQKNVITNQQYKGIEQSYNFVKEALDRIPLPVFIINSENNLEFTNLAGSSLPGILNEKYLNNPAENNILFKPLAEIINKTDYDTNSPSELIFPDKHFYIVKIASLDQGYTGSRLVILLDSTADKERQQKQNDFIGTVSHDMRSPLTLVKGYINMLEMVGSLNDQQKEFIQKIIINVDSMTKLVNNILDIERLESGIGLKKELTSPEEMLDETISELRPSADQKNIQIDCIKETNEKVFMDRFLLKQAMYNLIENGIKYSAVGGKIEIKLTKNDRTIEFVIQDHGVGIAPIDLPKIFDKEYRSNLKNQDQIRGAGLGLSIVKSIAERHNGKVWVESQLGKGSTFHLEIPVVESE